MKTIFANDAAMLLVLAASLAAFAFAMTMQTSGEAIDGVAARRTFAEEKAVTLQAASKREDFAAKARACLEAAASIEQLRGCLDAEYAAMTGMEALLRPLKSRPETMADIAAQI